MKKPTRRDLLADTAGLSTVEYIIILVLVAVVGITAWRTFGNTIKAKITGGTSRINTDLDPNAN